MKKKYSLDYDIVYADERCEAIHNIIDELDADPNATDLEQMADYILFGKDDTLLSAVDVKEISMPKRRYNSYATKAEQNESLDSLLEDPVVAQEIENTARPVGPDAKSPYKVCRQEIVRTTYAPDGTVEKMGDDFDNEGNPIPFMRELWASIDKWQERYEMYCGRKDPNEWVLSHPITKYNLYKLNHFIIDLRRQQYYIKDVYNPALHLFGASHGSHGPIDFNCDTGLWLEPSEWCERKRHPHEGDLQQPSLDDVRENRYGQLFWKISNNKLDYENPSHILALLDNYVSLLKRSYTHPDSPTRMVCWDIEMLIEDANLTEVEQWLLEQRVAHRNLFLVRKALEEENITLSETQLRHTIRVLIPRKIANAAKRRRLISEMERGRLPSLTCTKCGTKLPRNSFFFARARDKKTGFCSQCKDCQRKARQARSSKPHKNIEVKI